MHLSRLIWTAFLASVLDSTHAEIAQMPELHARDSITTEMPIYCYPPPYDATLAAEYLEDWPSRVITRPGWSCVPQTEPNFQGAPVHLRLLRTVTDQLLFRFRDDSQNAGDMVLESLGLETEIGEKRPRVTTSEQESKLARWRKGLWCWGA
jgi:hypothetical protein